MAEEARHEPGDTGNSGGTAVAINGSAVKAEKNAREADQAPGSPGSGSNDPLNAQPQRKRNKPSLSCESCTCDRVRPMESHRALGIDAPRKKPKSSRSTASAPATLSKSNGTHNGHDPPERALSRSSTGSSPMLLSNLPFSYASASNIFKVEHPFSNYWKVRDGLKEVISVLPSKDQADILIAKYWDAVDPVYPMIQRETFQRDYDFFWSLSQIERSTFDGSIVPLIFVMLAMGTQFVALPSPDQKEQTAEFYVSASHQALRLVGYLSRPSLRSIQTMVLITYFLMNDNHAADAWAFAGILIRQAYALGLNRDPSVTVPEAHPSEKQQRRKLWQAVLFQDTFLTIILRLPPTATHTDVRVEDLEPEAENPVSATDVSYISSMWHLANIVQSTICTPRSLQHPISLSVTSRIRLVASFHHIYMSFPLPFRSFSEASICDMAGKSKRLARQTLFLTSNYFHCLMLIYSDEHDNMEVDVRGTLDAAHEAISSFFLLHTLFEDEARVWYHFQHRAFSEAHFIAELLKTQGDTLAIDAVRTRAENDVLRMIGILQLSSDHDIMSKTRVSILSQYL